MKTSMLLATLLAALGLAACDRPTVVNKHAPNQRCKSHPNVEGRQVERDSERDRL